MAYPFEQQDITVAAHLDEPVDAPEIYHGPQSQWKNEGIRVYKEVFGEESWKRYTKTNYPIPMPAPSVGERTRLWLLLTQLRTLLSLGALLSGRRGTHYAGVGARGSLTIVANPEFPEHEFFQAGRTFPCRLRHANASFVADTNAVVRGCALKFADSTWESPLDLPMNSGATAAFWDLKSFAGFARGRNQSKPKEGNWEPQKEFTRVKPAALIGAIESIRDAPSSYADLIYFSKVIFPFRARDGRKRYVKYRILRGDLSSESGLLSYERQLKVWDQSPNPDDDRPLDYLRQEYKGRLLEKPVEYLLQIKLWDWDQERDSHEVFNVNRLWDEETHPWLDLAHVRLTEALPDEEMEVTRVWLGHQPPSLGITGAYSQFDYRSLAWARTLVYPTSQAARRTYRRFRGAPKPFEDRRY